MEGREQRARHGTSLSRSGTGLGLLKLMVLEENPLPPRLSVYLGTPSCGGGSGG